MDELWLILQNQWIVAGLACCFLAASVGGYQIGRIERESAAHRPWHHDDEHDTTEHGVGSIR